MAVQPVVKVFGIGFITGVLLPLALSLAHVIPSNLLGFGFNTSFYLAFPIALILLAYVFAKLIELAGLASFKVGWRAGIYAAALNLLVSFIFLIYRLNLTIAYNLSPLGLYIVLGTISGLIADVLFFMLLAEQNRSAMPPSTKKSSKFVGVPSTFNHNK